MIYRLVCLLVAGLSLTGAPIVWSNGGNFSGPNGHLALLTDGTYVEAVNWGGGDVTVGGDLFVGRLGAPFLLQDFSGIGSATNDADFNLIISDFTWSGFGAAPSLHGLTVGRQYRFQAFLADDRQCCSARVVTLDDNSTGAPINVTLGSYISVIGTFTADDTSQVVSQTNAPGEASLFNAWMLRDVTPAPPTGVPEPGAVILTAAGLSVLAIRRYRRARS